MEEMRFGPHGFLCFISKLFDVCFSTIPKKKCRRNCKKRLDVGTAQFVSLLLREKILGKIVAVYREKTNDPTDDEEVWVLIFMKQGIIRSDEDRRESMDAIALLGEQYDFLYSIESKGGQY